MSVSLKKKGVKAKSPEQKREDNLNEFIGSVVKKDSDIVKMTAIRDSVVVPTNMVSYNRASVVGGLVSGTSYSLCGKSQGGKTLFGIIACNAFANTGYPSLYVDAETTANKIWFKALKMDLSKGLYLVPENLEHASEKVFGFIKDVAAFRKKKKVAFPGLVITDSYNKLRPKEELKKSEIDGRKFPYHAACFTDFMNKLTYQLYHNDIIFMVVRHDRANLGRKSDYEPATKTSGAQTLNHDSSLIVRFDISKKDIVTRNKKKFIHGYWHKFKVEKSKDGIKDEEGKFYISNGKGYVPLGYCQYKTAIEEAVYQGRYSRKEGGSIVDNLTEGVYSSEEDLWNVLTTVKGMFPELLEYLNNYWNRMYDAK